MSFHKKGKVFHEFSTRRILPLEKKGKDLTSNRLKNHAEVNIDVYLCKHIENSCLRELKNL